MDIKPHPNNHRYITILRTMTPEQKLQKVFELNALGKELHIAGLRRKHPGMNEKDLHRVYIKSVESCHNRNY